MLGLGLALLLAVHGWSRLIDGDGVGHCLVLCLRCSGLALLSLARWDILWAWGQELPPLS